jgi:hypothetical protein
LLYEALLISSSKKIHKIYGRLRHATTNYTIGLMIWTGEND